MAGGEQMRTFVKRTVGNESGATAIEYGLIAALISIGIIASVSSIGKTVNNTLGKAQAGVASK